MPGRVVNYENNYDETVPPKTLHGVKEVKMLIIQCSNSDGRTQVLLGVEIEPGDVRTLPEKTWEQLGRPSSWLMDQINEQYYGRRAAVEQPVAAAPKKTSPETPVEMDGAI